MSETFTSWLLVWPILVPILGAAAAVIAWTRPRLQYRIGLAGISLQFIANAVLFAHVLSNGPQAAAMGGWPAPFGIALAADLLSALLALAACSVALLILLARSDARPGTRPHPGFHPLTLALMAGVNGAFLTSDIFNLYVWFEVSLIATFGLMVLPGQRARIDSAVKYAFLNMIATTLLLIAIGLLYGMTGSLNMADLSRRISDLNNPAALDTVALLFLVALAMKSAVFPLAFWLPASYHVATPTISALFGALLTKVGVYSMVRTFNLVFPEVGDLARDALLWAAAATMLIGALGALAETDLRRMVSFTIMSGVGVMLFGLALGSETALTGSIFYLVHSMLISAALFLGVGLVVRAAGTPQLYAISDLYKTAPLLSATFLLCGFSLAGVPPFAGFWPKVLLIKAGLAGENFAALAAMLVSGLIILLAIGRCFALAFWRARPTDTPQSPGLSPAQLVVLIMTVLTVALGVYPAPLIGLSEVAAAGLLDHQAYIAAVLRTDSTSVMP